MHSVQCTVTLVQKCTLVYFAQCTVFNVQLTVSYPEFGVHSDGSVAGVGEGGGGRHELDGTIGHMELTSTLYKHDVQARCTSVIWN